eukprot:5039767-Amphidinium_carterae.1
MPVLSTKCLRQNGVSDYLPKQAHRVCQNRQSAAMKFNHIAPSTIRAHSKSCCKVDSPNHYSPNINHYMLHLLASEFD